MSETTPHGPRNGAGPGRARRKVPRSSRTGKPLTRRQRLWRRARRTVYALVALGIIGPIVAFMVAYVVVTVPQPADINTNQVATVLYADGTTPLSKIVPPEGNRTDVKFSEIPVQLREAVLAAEDRSFYTNPGFSPTGIARAAFNNLTGGDTQGGSTITQQYVKNAVTGDQRTLARKFKELVISSKMSRQSSKDDILTAYLNTIYFGRGAYGVSAASQAYFGKSVSDLSVAESAVLAASIRSPSFYDPAVNPGPAKKRWGYVLDGMVSQGWLTQADRGTLTYPTVAPRALASNGSSTQGPQGLVVQRVKAELTANGISERDLNTEGLQITTTIDKKAQDAALNAVQTTLADQPKNLAPAVVSIDPRTGGVRAYYGNADGTGFDYADSWGIQPGSSFKVFTLATALKAGVPLSKRFDGSSPQTIAGTEVSNSDGESCGRCNLATALKLSLNTVYYQLADDVGAKNIAATAHAAGIPTKTSDGKPSLANNKGQVDLGITLGAYEVPPLYMASAYGTLADNGVQHDPYFVQKVTTADGKVLLDRGPRGASTGKQAIDAPVAQNVISAMEPIAAASRDHGLADGRQSAAKTGTAQLKDTGKNANGWMIGCTPSLCTASVVTTTDQTAADTKDGQIIYGSGLPSDIWKATMDGALAGSPQETFPDAPELSGDSGGVPEVPTYEPPSPPISQAPASTTAPPPTTTPPTTTAPPATTPPPVSTAPSVTRLPVTTATPAPPATTTKPRPTAVGPSVAPGGGAGAPGGAPIAPGGGAAPPAAPGG